MAGSWVAKCEECDFVGNRHEEMSDAGKEVTDHVSESDHQSAHVVNTDS